MDYVSVKAWKFFSSLLFSLLSSIAHLPMAELSPKTSSSGNMLHKQRAMERRGEGVRGREMKGRKGERDEKKGERERRKGVWGGNYM
jgi:hypothetical protein